jgi:AhpD family alkylhydroperoxidase
MRFIGTTPPTAAQGLTARVYAQVKRDFRLLKNPAGASPFLAHSPAPALLAGFWSSLYETVLVEHRLHRGDKELIAAAVSDANRCAFCADTHTLLAKLAENGRPRGSGPLSAWAEATSSAGRILAPPPFASEATAEAIGTVALFEYLNRVVNVFVGPSRMIPAPAPLRRPIEYLVGRYARPAVESPHAPARTLDLLPESELPPDLSWAASSPHVAGALARFSGAVERAAGRELPAEARARISATASTWDGTEPELGSSWIDERIDGLAPESRAVARLGLITAFASHRIDDGVVTAFRAFRRTDESLVTAVAWAAFTAARRVADRMVGDAVVAGAGARG